jgi:hypothetical protein
MKTKQVISNKKLITRSTLLSKYVDIVIVVANYIALALKKLMKHLLGVQGIDPNAAHSSRLYELYLRALEPSNMAQCVEKIESEQKTLEDLGYESGDYYDNAIVDFVFYANNRNITDPRDLDTRMSEILDKFSEISAKRHCKPQMENNNQNLESRRSGGDGNDFMTPCTNEEQIKPDPIIIINDDKMPEGCRDYLTRMSEREDCVKEIIKAINDNKPLVLDTPTIESKNVLSEECNWQQVKDAISASRSYERI